MKFTQTGNTIKIGYQTLGNSIPSSCLLKYVAAVDAKLSGHGSHGSLQRSGSVGRMWEGHGSSGSITPVQSREDDAAKKILKQKGCECHNTVYLNLATTTAK